MSGPYRALPPRRARRGRSLDPWLLALLFAWVCDVARIAVLVADHQRIAGEAAFGALLAVISVVVILRAVKS